MFAQLPFPAASLAVLRVFSKLARIERDLGELADQAEAMGQNLGEILAEIERRLQQQNEAVEERTHSLPLRNRFSNRYFSLWH